MSFSTTVKQVRQDMGISQEELAHALNVSYVTINRWENGKTEPNRLTKSVFFSFCSKKGIKIKEKRKARETAFNQRKAKYGF